MWFLTKPFAAVGLSVLVFAMVWFQMSGNVFPPGDDPGNWLKRVNAVAGRTYPLWDETVFTYPPLFFIVCHVISTILGDSLAALKLAAALVFSTIPLATFLLARGVAGSYVVGLAAAGMAALFPAYFEMLWWGAYPNLLALALMPIALLALLKAQEGSFRYLCLAMVFGALLLITHHLTSLVYVATLIMALLVSLVERDKESIKANLLILAVMVSLFVGYWHGAVSAYVQRNPFISRPGLVTIDFMLWMFKSPVLLDLTVVTATIGLVQLLILRRVKEFTLVLGWLASSLLLTQIHFLGVVIDYTRFLFMAMIPLFILASVPLSHLRRCMAVSKTVGENSIYEVEIQVEKVIPAFMVLIMLLAMLGPGLAASKQAYAHYTWTSKYEGEGRLRALNWIKQNTLEEATIVSDFHFGRWVEGYAQRRALFPIPPEVIFISSEFERYQVADTIMGSSHQLANEYVKLDEWQPVSSQFSPLISVFQGNRYVDLVYVSDAFVRVNLTRDGGTWIEAPYNAWLYQSKWLERSHERAGLQFLFRTMGLVIEKRLDLQAGQPAATVTYRVEPKPNATLNTLSLNVYLMRGRALHQAKVDGNRVTLVTDAGALELTFIGELLGLEVGKDWELNQDRVYAKFEAEPDRAEVSVVVTALSGQPSWVRGVWAASSGELERDYGVTHIAVPADSYAVQRFNARLPEGPVVYVDDCFARVVFMKAGTQWVEAPYRARVLSEETKNLGGAEVYVTMYETIALHINRTLVQRGSSLEVKYGIKAKEGVALQGFQLLVWLAWGRLVSDAEVRGGKVLLVTNAGALEVAPKGEVLELAYGLDEEFHVPRVLIDYALKPGQDEASLTVTGLNDGSSVEARVDVTTRPVMESSDKITILIKAKHYREVFRGSGMVMYEVPKCTT